MKYTHPSFRWVTLAPALLACLIGACGSDDSTPPPTNPPQMDASPIPDQSSPPPDVNTTFDAGSLTCGTATCTGRIVGGSIGVACCAGAQMNVCGLQFLGSTQCIDQSDSGGFQPPPPSDAGPIVDDPSCGNVSITFGGMSFPLNGCCRANGQCGWYSPQATAQGCASPEQLSMIPGTVVPDAPIACSAEGGTRPDAGPPDTSRPETGTPDSTPTPDTGTSDGGGADATPDNTAPPDTAMPDGTTVDSAGDTGPQSDGASPDAGTD